MKVTHINEAQEYKPAGHYDMRALRLHGADTSNCKDFTLGLSHFLPGGRTDYTAAGVELIYCVTEGELTVTAGGQEHVLRRYDSIHFDIGDERSVENKTNLPASMMVIAGMPK